MLLKHVKSFFGAGPVRSTDRAERAEGAEKGFAEESESAKPGSEATKASHPPIKMEGREVSGNTTNGYGVYEFADGERHEGEWRNGKAHGRGTHTFPSGQRYEGEHRDGKQHGRGTHTWPDGQRYEGEYKDGKKHGRGTHTWPDGQRYEGEWQDDQQHGRGKHSWPDGKRYEGEWRNGKTHGRGTWADAGGGSWEGFHSPSSPDALPASTPRSQFITDSAKASPVSFLDDKADVCARSRFVCLVFLSLVHLRACTQSCLSSIFGHALSLVSRPSSGMHSVLSLVFGHALSNVAQCEHVLSERLLYHATLVQVRASREGRFGPE